jgi:hypothetical protein
MTTDPHARLAEFLSIGDTRQNLPGVKIRDAATMLVIDRTGRTPKVLLGRRHHGHKFMPGKYVFAGGRVELADRRVSAATPLDKRVEARLMKRYATRAQKSRGFRSPPFAKCSRRQALSWNQPIASLPGGVGRAPANTNG